MAIKYVMFVFFAYTYKLSKLYLLSHLQPNIWLLISREQQFVLFDWCVGIAVKMKFCPTQDYVLLPATIPVVQQEPVLAHPQTATVISSVSPSETAA